MTGRVRWLDDLRLELDGLVFRLDVSRERPLEDVGAEIVLMKPRIDLVNAYIEALEPYSGGNVVELGIWGGGSTIFFERLMRPKKLIAIELDRDVPAVLEKHAAECGTIVPYFGVNQGDREQLRTIMERELAGEQLDVIIDDASHRYEPTKASFNTLFPLLRPGGRYFIEDWGWAHWRGRFQEHWGDEPALTNLVFELTMVVASWGGYMVSRVEVSHGFVSVERGSGQVPGPRAFDASALYLARGRKLELI
jgi:SAM-dependent methyltransferase